MLRDVVTGDNTASDVWADTAYRSQANEKWLKAQGLFIRSIGIKRAEAKITLADLPYNMNRLIFHERRTAMG